MTKVLIGGIVGGIVVFVWGFVSHMLLPIGTMGVDQLENEERVVDALTSSIEEPGLYVVPWMDPDLDPASDEYKAWAETMESGPNAFLVYHPTGVQPLSVKQLGMQFATGLVAALLMAIVLLQTGSGFFGRVLVATLMGLFSWVSISVAHWNWYRFPIEFTGAEGVDQVVGFVLAGLVMATFVKPARATS